MQIDIRPGETRTDLLRRVLSDFGLSPEFLRDVTHFGQNAGITGGDAFILRDRTTQESIEVLFNQTGSRVTNNDAFHSVQVNMAVGPSSQVSHNTATHAQQRNYSVCIIL